jgi:threonine aldolase
MAFADGTADFRSDTVTRPTPEMFAAMASAPLGDDVYHDDPTVNALEEESASLVGKDAGLFVPSGTMGNQLAVMAQTNPGEEVLVEESSHIRSVEGGSAQVLSGVGFRTVAANRGRISPDGVRTAMSTAGFFPRIGLMVWENTHVMSGGRVVPLAVMDETTPVAREEGLRIHLDGARIFNAVAATGVDAITWANHADTIQFCYSKGLGAPIGSIVCGPADLVEEMRYLRKRLGGGMRQVGVIAAAARIALEHRHDLSADHELASELAEGLNSRFPGAVEEGSVETNIVQVDLGSVGLSWGELAGRLGDARVRANAPFAGTWRLVTHRDVDRSDVQRLLDALTNR